MIQTIKRSEMRRVKVMGAQSVYYFHGFVEHTSSSCVSAVVESPTGKTEILDPISFTFLPYTEEEEEQRKVPWLRNNHEQELKNSQTRPG